MEHKKEILHPAAEVYIQSLESQITILKSDNTTLTCAMLNHSELTELEEKYEAEIFEKAGISLTRRLEADEIIGRQQIEIQNLKNQVQALVTIMELYPNKD